MIFLGVMLSQVISDVNSSYMVTSRSANEILATLPVAGEYAQAPYDAARFPHWVDADKDCLDTRNEVLKRDSRVPTRGKCKITSGLWISWVDGKRVKNPTSLDIDHMVPLAEAWESGASQWSPAQRRSFANDLGFAWTLQAISLSVNRSKQDRDPADWFPSSTAARCAYAQRWVAVKYRWGLAVDVKEKAALESILVGSCGAQKFMAPKRVAGIPQPTGAGSSTGATPTVISQTTLQSTQTVTPGAFCSNAGETGVSASGKTYTCKESDTEDRLRWRP